MTLNEKNESAEICHHGCVYLKNRCTVTLLVLITGTYRFFPGMGDSPASFFGSKFGQTTFPGSSKTVEGTAAAVVAQVVFVVAVDLLFIDGVVFSASVVAAATLCSVIEATTTQVDNLVLPLVMFLLLSVLT